MHLGLLLDLFIFPGLFWPHSVRYLALSPCRRVSLTSFEIAHSATSIVSTLPVVLHPVAFITSYILIGNFMTAIVSLDRS